MIWQNPVKLPRPVLGLATIAILCLGIVARDGNWTDIHEPGRCAIRGQCGKKSFFGGDLPCPDNGKAEDPEKETRDKLVAICGDSWEEGPVCCDDAQVRGFSGSRAQITQANNELGR